MVQRKLAMAGVDEVVATLEVEGVHVKWIQSVASAEVIRMAPKVGTAAEAEVVLVAPNDLGHLHEASLKHGAVRLGW